MSARPRRRRSSRERRLRDTSGFTLVEVLVAFTVMATLLPVLYRGVVTMRSGALAYDAHIQQQIVARAVLEDALAKRDVAAGRYTGIRDGHRWTLVVKPIDLSAQMPKKDSADADAPPASPARKVAGQGEKGTAAEGGKPHWQTQKLIVRLETKGRPVEIETIRLAAIKDAEQ